MPISKAVILTGVVLTALLAACGPPGVKLSEETIDTGGDRVLVAADPDYQLTANDYFKDVSSIRMLMSGGTLEDDRARFLLDSIVLDSLAGLSAHEVELDDYYTIYRTFQLQYYDYLLYTYWQRTLYDHITADSLEAVQFYNDNKDLFVVDEQVSLYHILVSPYGLTVGPDSTYYKSLSRDDLWKKTHERAWKLAKLIDWGEPFENVAYWYSNDVTSREKGGFVGWTTRNTYYDPFDSVAFSLQIGEHSRPYRDRDGWHIIYIDGYVPHGPVPIDSSSVYESAYESLLTKKGNVALEKRLDSLRKEIRITPNPLVLDTNIHLVEDTVWCALVNSQDTIDARYLKTFEEGYRRKYDVDNTTPEIKMEMMRQAGDRFIQVQAARQAGIDTLPEVVAERERLAYLKKKAIVLGRAYDYTWEPTDSAIDAYYYAHIDDYQIKRPLEVKIVSVADSTFAEFLREQAATGIDLDSLPRRFGDQGFNIGVSRRGYYAKDEIPRSLVGAVMVTEVGSTSRVAFNPERNLYQFAKLYDRKRSRAIEFARGDIKKTLQEQYRRKLWESYRDQMYKKFNVRVLATVAEVTLGNYHERTKPSS